MTASTIERQQESDGIAGQPLRLWVMATVVLLCSLCAHLPTSTGEYFSSVDRLITLGDIELGLVESFREFFQEREKEFASYRKFIEHVKAQHEEALNNTEDFLGNPINAYTLIKRMVVDWNQMREAIKNSPARQTLTKLVAQLNNDTPIPEQDELVGAVKGLARLQKLYNLPTADLAKGTINKVHYDTDLNWHDCFEIAATLYEQKELVLAITWFEATLELLEEHGEHQDFSLQLVTEDTSAIDIKFKIDCYEYLALAHYDLGRTAKAVEYIDAILKLSPDHNVKDMRAYMLSAPSPKAIVPDKLNQFPWYKNYSSLCRGEQRPEKFHLRLKCSVSTQNNPYFVLAPLRKERISYEPDVVLYHGLLNDQQIEKISRAAEDNMQRSRVVNGTGSKESEVRISQQCWLHYDIPTTVYVQRLLGQLTGLDMNNAELMQVANYGIGGQYEPHNDFFGTERRESTYIGDRIATTMFYLSDVEHGGYTVFPKVNLFLRPVKGAMVRWYNMHRSVQGDYRTLHAGCPVIKGSKRIANIWIHTGLQEFRRPCDLKPDHFKSAAYH